MPTQQVADRSRWARWTTRRAVAAVPVVLAALTLAFALLHLVPGDPVAILLNPANGGGGTTPEQEAQLRHQLGLDRPLLAQYGSYLLQTVRGDLGHSLQTGQSVTSLIAENAPASAALAAGGLVVGVVIGSALAFAAALTRVRLLASALTGLGVLTISMPTYWVGILLVEGLSFQLRLLPASGNGGLAFLVLPAVTLGLPVAGITSQILTTSLREALDEPYAAIALAKGAGRMRLVVRHALRNAAIPAMTVLGTSVGNLLAGAVVVETVFGRQGLGRLLVTAITNHDYPVVQGLIFVVAATYVVANVVVDALYAWVDPRVAVTA